MKKMQDKSKLLHKVLGDLVTEIRIDKGIKYLDFCDGNSIATSTYDNIVNGKTKVTFHNVYKIVKAFGLTFEQFGKLLDEHLPEDFWDNDDD